MPFLDRLQSDLVSAMKTLASVSGAEKEAGEMRLSTLRMMKTALQKYAADTAKPVDDPAAQQVLKTLVKQRVDAAQAFRNGGREELAMREDAERAIIESYLPAAPSDAEIDEAVTAAILETKATNSKQMGTVIKAAQTKLAGKTVDGKLLSEKVKARLQ